MSGKLSGGEKESGTGVSRGAWRITAISLHDLELVDGLIEMMTR